MSCIHAEFCRAKYEYRYVRLIKRVTITSQSQVVPFRSGRRRGAGHETRAEIVTWAAVGVAAIQFRIFHTAKILKPNCLLVCHTPAAQVAISILALSSQHSRCIETHTKVRPITSLTLSLVVEDGERELATNYMSW